MTALNKQALREAAEKALPAMKRLLMMPNDELFDEALLNVDGDVDAANAFNLNFGPETALELLNENLQLQRDKDSLEAVAIAMRDDMRDAREKQEELDNALCELLPGTQYMDPPDGGSVTPLEQVRRMVADYRERIEELESRTVILPNPYPKGYGLAADKYNFALEECADAIRAAGIGVKGE
ncbi:ead/Ea22-like family protein [Citrobacter sp. Cpo061]|uniref:ead/Ea22-like family protein n=1 Tax=Citrobacter TaxID=544 RepID=UPI0024479C1E|nr:MULTISPECIES: ead/Ea22-like family protein [Citrobacter]MDH1798995.1 ead/Ea22-like family protein [Citrobacter portucalensis]MDM2867627.1 ead/Ea22-like family protein [Citrobacter sp. Cpo061]